MHSGYRTCWKALGAVLLHVDVGIQMVQGAIGLLTLAPVADIEPLNLIKATTRSLLGVDTRQRNKGVDLGSIHAPVQAAHVSAVLRPASWVQNAALLVVVPVMMVLGRPCRVRVVRSPCSCRWLTMDMMEAE